MLFLKKLAVLFVALFSISSVHAEEGDYFTFTINDDTQHEVIFDIPNGWDEIEEKGTHFYDLKLKDTSGQRQCLFWFTKIDDVPLNATVLKDISFELEEILFPAIKTRDHSIGTGTSLCWHTFQTGLQDQPHFIGMAVFSIDEFVFAVVVENDKDVQTLMDDADLFLKNVSLLTNK